MVQADQVIAVVGGDVADKVRAVRTNIGGKDGDGICKPQETWVTRVEGSAAKGGEVAFRDGRGDQQSEPEVTAVIALMAASPGRSPSCKHRRHPIRALACIGRGAVEAVPALIEVVGEADALQEQEVSDVYYAVCALEGIGPSAREAIPVLEKLRDGEAGRKSIDLKWGRVTLRSIAETAIQIISGK